MWLKERAFVSTGGVEHEVYRCTRCTRIPVYQLRRRERLAPYQTRHALLNGGLVILKDCVLESLPSRIV